MTIYFATDHAGLALKDELFLFVRDELGHTTEDCGAFVLDEGDDFPDFISVAAGKVAASETDRAIILGGSGQGEAMCANRYKGVRAAVYYGGNADIVRLSREHNDANVLSLGARFVSSEEAKEAVRVWLSSAFSSDEKYARRNAKLDR